MATLEKALVHTCFFGPALGPMAWALCGASIDSQMADYDLVEELTTAHLVHVIQTPFFSC